MRAWSIWFKISRFSSLPVMDILDPQDFFDELRPLFLPGYRPGLLIDGVVDPGLEAGNHPVNLLIKIGGLLELARDDQGRPGLIDEDAVHLVDDGVVEGPLYPVVPAGHHIVPQVVEAKFIVGAVGNVGGIGFLALFVVQAVDDEAHGEIQELIDLAHPFTVPAGQVVVDGNDVDPLPRQGIEVGRQGGHQGLPLPRLHLGNPALV